ncbi:MAG: DUF5674 family protein [candidate division KSB1 bacterium]|nr:DUF5674 family protein [candidate division KSB1 bacterium]
MIHILSQKATRQQIDEMLEELDPLIKLAVDVRRDILAGGGQMHADCESVLIQNGSRQEDIWGANWIPATQTLECEALINIRPQQQNFSMTIQDAALRQKVETIVKQLLEGV